MPPLARNTWQLIQPLRHASSLRKHLIRPLHPPGRVDEHNLRETLRGKTLLITGASSGIGAATARLLSGPGVHLILIARNRERLAEVCRDVERNGGTATYHCADFRRLDEVEVLGQRLAQDYSAIEIIVSNAGKSIRRSLGDTSPQSRDIVRCGHVNYISPALLISHLLPGMIGRGRGHVIGVSTVSARLPAAPRWSAYQSSKTAFDVWLQVAATEFHKKGIQFTSIYLPLVHTPMSEPSAVFAHVPGMSAEDAAATVAYAILSRRRRVGPWWLRGLELLSVIFRRPIEFALSHDFGRKS